MNPWKVTLVLGLLTNLGLAQDVIPLSPGGDSQEKRIVIYPTDLIELKTELRAIRSDFQEVSQRIAKQQAIAARDGRDGRDGSTAVIQPSSDASTIITVFVILGVACVGVFWVVSRAVRAPILQKVVEYVDKPTKRQEALELAIKDYARQVPGADVTINSFAQQYEQGIR